MLFLAVEAKELKQGQSVIVITTIRLLPQTDGTKNYYNHQQHFKLFKTL